MEGRVKSGKLFDGGAYLVCLCVWVGWVGGGPFGALVVVVFYSSFTCACLHSVCSDSSISPTSFGLDLRTLAPGKVKCFPGSKCR